jgi:hypothetical protein
MSGQKTVYPKASLWESHGDRVLFWLMASLWVAALAFRFVPDILS